MIWLVAIAAFVLAASDVHAQRFRFRHRVPRPPTVARARVMFAEAREAWNALRALDVQPADANGAVRAWDQRWASRLARLSREESDACSAVPIGEAGTCSQRQVDALACNVAIEVTSTRSGLLDPNAPRALDASEPMAAREALAEEAARRQQLGLSCEDLPNVVVLHRDSCGRWYSYSTPLVPGQPAPDSPCSLPPVAAEDPTVCGSMAGTHEAVPEASQRRFEANLPRIRACLAQAPEAPRGVLAVVISRDGERRAIDLAGPCTLTTGEMATCLRDAVRDVAVEDYEQLRWWMSLE